MKIGQFILSQSCKLILPAFFILAMILNSCKREDSLSQIVTRIQGSRILMPEESCDSTIFGMKYITYVDSLGCVTCKLQLEKWKAFQLRMAEQNRNVGIFYIVHPEVYENTKLLMEIAEYHPDKIICDKENNWVKNNHIPSNDLLHTLLLDENDSVILVGNPIRNKKIEELFFKILEERKDKQDKK